MRLIRETVALLAVVFQVATVVYFWNRLPTTIPIHFNAAGTPDSWGDRSTLLFVPVITVFLYGLLTLVSFFPKLFNYPVEVTDENRARLEAVSIAMLGWLKAEIACACGYITWAIVQVSGGRAHSLGLAFLPVLLAALAATVTIGIVQTRRAAKPISSISGAAR